MYNTQRSREQTPICQTATYIRSQTHSVYLILAQLACAYMKRFTHTCTCDTTSDIASLQHVDVHSIKMNVLVGYKYIRSETHKQHFIHDIVIRRDYLAVFTTIYINIRLRSSITISITINIRCDLRKICTKKKNGTVGRVLFILILLTIKYRVCTQA